MNKWLPLDFGRYTGVGIQLAVSVLVGISMGYFLDSKYKKFPIFTAICSLIGTIFGFYNLYIQLRDSNHKKD